MSDVFNPPVRPAGTVPALPPQRTKRSRFIRVGETDWVDRKRVRAVSEEYYSGTSTWVVRVYCTGQVTVTGNGRAADIIAILNGEDLR